MSLWWNTCIRRIYESGIGNKGGGVGKVVCPVLQSLLSEGRPDLDHSGWGERPLSTIICVKSELMEDNLGTLHWSSWHVLYF